MIDFLCYYCIIIILYILIYYNQNQHLSYYFFNYDACDSSKLHTFITFLLSSYISCPFCWASKARAVSFMLSLGDRFVLLWLVKRWKWGKQSSHTKNVKCIYDEKKWKKSLQKKCFYHKLKMSLNLILTLKKITVWHLVKYLNELKSKILLSATVHEMTEKAWFSECSWQTASIGYFVRHIVKINMITSGPVQRNDLF